MTRWDGDDLALLARTASDLTALAATIEVLVRLDPHHPTLQRAQQLASRMNASLSTLIVHLKD